jgi:hypothetical protein
MKKETAIAFSNSQFGENYTYLADDIEWDIFGENLLHGKKSVIKHCEQVVQYFRTVETNFETYHVIENSTVIVINGKAEFRREQKKVAVVNSCDIYEFNSNGQIQNIKSYCITEKN